MVLNSYESCMIIFYYTKEIPCMYFYIQGTKSIPWYQPDSVSFKCLLKNTSLPSYYVRNGHNRYILLGRRSDIQLRCEIQIPSEPKDCSSHAVLSLLENVILSAFCSTPSSSFSLSHKNLFLMILSQ